MKCDHLIGRKFDGDVYVLASDAMEAIAELKQKLEDVNELIKTAQKMIEDAKATAYAGVDAGMENRRLKRALYKALANWAFLAQWERGKLVENWEKWEEVERKCGAKAKEYK